MNFNKEIKLNSSIKGRVLREEEVVVDEETITKIHEGFVDMDHIRLVSVVHEPRKKRLTLKYKLGKYRGGEWSESEDVNGIVFNGKGYLVQNLSPNCSEQDYLEVLASLFKGVVKDRGQDA